MSLYKFRETEDIEELLMKSIPDELMLPGRTADEVVYFQNGDKMTINLKTGLMEFETIHPGEMFHSRLQMNLNRWYSRQLIKEIQMPEVQSA